MANSTPQINGITFPYITRIDRTVREYASVNRARNGTLTKTIAGKKREWTLEFAEDMPLSAITTLRTIANLTTSFAFVDEDGNSYTVTTDEEALTDSVEQGATRLYSGSMQLLEV